MRLFNHRYLKIFFLITLTITLVQGCFSNLTKMPELNQVNFRAAECKVITHPSGESCIPVEPERIIALDEISMEALLALDIKPIGAIKPNISGSIISKLGEKAEGIVSLGKNSQPNIEKIALLNPDLILGFFISNQQYQLFSQIAPTVTLDYTQTGWKKSLLRIAEITGKTEKAQTLLEKYQQRVEILQTLISDKLKDKTVSISRFYAGRQFTEFRSQYSFPGSLLTEVGIQLPEIQNKLTTNENQSMISLSLERLDLLDADILFIALDPGAKETFQKYQNSPLWQKLNVVKNQQVYTVDSSYWIFGNILSANAILDDLFTYLIKPT